MIRFLPLLLLLFGGLFYYRFSAARTARALERSSVPLRDPELLRLSARMADQLDLPELKVRIYEIDPINGLAAPDGRIFITRGFFRKYQSGLVTAEEMASVIAHELGHVALGHARRRLLDFAGANAVRMLLMTIIGRFVPFVGPYLVNILVSMLSARLSRQDEYEADAYAAALLTKAGIGVQPQIDMFKKLDYLAGSSGGGQLAWLMSHPRTDERIAALEKLRAGWS